VDTLVLVFALALEAGCAPAPLQLPDAIEIGTVGVLVDGAQRTLHLAPFDAETAAVPLLEAEAEGTLYALYFPRTYVMPHGASTDSDTQPWSRPLPFPERVLRRAWSDGAWTQVSAEALPPFALGVESPIACAERGGCYQDEHARACTVPCPPRARARARFTPGTSALSAVSIRLDRRCSARRMPWPVGAVSTG